MAMWDWTKSLDSDEPRRDFRIPIAATIWHEEGNPVFKPNHQNTKNMIICEDIWRDKPKEKSDEWVKEIKRMYKENGWMNETKESVGLEKRRKLTETWNARKTLKGNIFLGCGEKRSFLIHCKVEYIKAYVLESLILHEISFARNKYD